MYVAAVIVEQLEADGRIKRLTMEGSSAHQLTVAFPDEFAGERSGPFLFPDDENEARFEVAFSACKALALPKHTFKATNGDYSVRIERGGIPTEGQLSYYSLCLPEFAIPSEVALRDPISSKPLYKSVVRDKRRNRFVIYVECRSERGIFDFLLEVRFTIEKKRFPDFVYEDEYKDDFLSKYGRQVTIYERLLPPDQRRVVRNFLSDSAEPSQTITPPFAPATKFAAEQGTPSSVPANGDNYTDREKRGKHCHEVIEEARRIWYLSSRGQKMFEIKQEHADFQIWKVVSSLSKEDQQLFEHPTQIDAPVVTYTLGLLGKAYNKSWLTVRDWVKEYKRHSRAKK